MPIDPAALRSQQFRVVFRGYDVEEVDAFLDRLEEQLARPAEVPTAPEDDGPGGLPGRAVRTLLHAEQMAEQVLAEATAEATAVRTRAQEEAEAILADARARAAQLTAGAHLRSASEVDELVARGRRLRAELDRLEESERRCREELHGWLDAHGRLREPRPPAPAVPEPPARTPVQRDTPLPAVRRVVTTLPMSAVR
ncbi:DivIVA domain-containing protein [Geodermatophilus marinus]|uniref:DivIVA domain-containing protein n=1 Tax=Geodermatophilus sp. LHW52908 TaxID=2303986 RepID=UPI001313FF73|nr:DivIVA domain-containing protein [Geodermatophilus sp. LHW52908]